MTNEKNFTAWEELYQNQDITTMPWYQEGLDPDLIEAFDTLHIKGGKILDLGSGPGTQAIELAKSGFAVTATDISRTAAKQGKKLAQLSRLDISFLQDDILDTKLNEKFDFIWDRGLFHVIDPNERYKYIGNIVNLLNNGGILFLKGFSHKEKSKGGPNRIKPTDIEESFSNHFKIISIKETVFQGTLKKFPKALFCVLKLRRR